jgi:hypothetical protein
MLSNEIGRRTFNGLDRRVATFALVWACVLYSLTASLLAYGDHMATSWDQPYLNTGARVLLFFVLFYMIFGSLIGIVVAMLAHNSDPEVEISLSKPAPIETTAVMAPAYVIVLTSLYSTPIMANVYGISIFWSESRDTLGHELPEALMHMAWSFFWILSGLTTALFCLYWYFHLWGAFFATEENTGRLNCILTITRRTYLVVTMFFLVTAIRTYSHAPHWLAPDDPLFMMFGKTCFACVTALSALRLFGSYAVFKQPAKDLLSRIVVYLLAEWTFMIVQTFLLLLEFSIVLSTLGTMS